MIVLYDMYMNQTMTCNVMVVMINGIIAGKI